MICQITTFVLKWEQLFARTTRAHLQIQTRPRTEFTISPLKFEGTTRQLASEIRSGLGLSYYGPQERHSHLACFLLKKSVSRWGGAWLSIRKHRIVLLVLSIDLLRSLITFCGQKKWRGWWLQTIISRQLGTSTNALWVVGSRRENWSLESIIISFRVRILLRECCV